MRVQGCWVSSAMLWGQGKRCPRRCPAGVRVWRCSTGVRCWRRWRRVAVGGGEACSGIEVLRSELEVSAAAGSVSTVRRILSSMTAVQVQAAAAAMAEVLQRVWGDDGHHPRCGRRADVGASTRLRVVHSENSRERQRVARVCGCHLMYCSADVAGEVLGLVLRPGNAAADSISGHAAVLDAAVGAMGADFAAGHREGDDPGLVKTLLGCALARLAARSSCMSAASAAQGSAWWRAATLTCRQRCREPLICLSCGNQR